MNGFKHIQKIRDYCDYIEEHLKNVHLAWEEVYAKCYNLWPFTDDFLYHEMEMMILNHDISKMSHEEFIPYQKEYYPAEPITEANMLDDLKNLKALDAAWEHHKQHNPHHWENWTKRKDSYPNESVCHCVCMLCDWMAMGKTKGDTAEEFYERTKMKANLPKWADELLVKLFERTR